ncbi:MULTISPECIES: GLPGLI family protein [Chryseobacterium]|uniref:GLPGLI family protein n=1 Tax=Chryseobacterium camelliae TaxID=1265445 RepID=A0ABU0TDD0_9FLAO|nr:MULTISPECIES: GLPGLI family protein [Chryseobacterium]MDT3407138.1 GLPGLI family protein [Pseudacidovorax intermedius]MDQ1095070.1 GLPGLI family protein [Chryseobacterium camelliae]MDQ1099009.1 GLPGLI family protein [Chryseobacterium sp. SORGH_AS_1048]MDR6086357.1 GLPGLI family protein [Chryseobacterium sp. SORGH_AS_0909]MDR6130729.1 GLPGLI family protein [Chryseobacterium sp. SORGH_AS_1175]
MKKLLQRILPVLALTLLTHNMYFSQSYKIFYEMQWKNKSESTNHHELCSLITNEKGNSYFQSYENFRRDSTHTSMVNEYFANKAKGLRIGDGITNAKFRSLIIKNISQNTITVEERFFTSIFSIAYPSCKQHWKLIDDKTSIILGYKAYMASTEFGGRKWIAWYTKEIPISDGPYKFYGLPGLILKITDSDGAYTFEIKGIHKENNDLEKRNFTYDQPMNISPKQWDSFWKKYIKQPSVIFENLNTSQTTYVINGKDVNSKEVKESYNRKESEILKNFESPIELAPSCL